MTKVNKKMIFSKKFLREGLEIMQCSINRLFF